MLLGTGLGKIRECQQYRCHQKHHTHDEQARTEGFLHFIFKEQTHDAHRNHRHDDVQGIFRLFIHLKLKQSLQDPVNLTPEDDQCREHRCHMHSHGKLQVVGTIDTEECRDNGQVTTRTDRQVFRQSLYDSKNQSLYPIHILI